MAPPADPARTALTPLTIIRTETVLSRLPLHTLGKHGKVPIHITQKNVKGAIELYWQVSPNPVYGEPRQLAYKLDTIVIHQALHLLGQPLPKVLRLGSFAQICRDLDVVDGGNGHRRITQALLQNAATFLRVKLHYIATDGAERTLEAGFTRYSVVFTGERLPDGTTADAVYLILNEPYWEILNNAPTRPLDYDYLKALTPTAQRCYELLSYKLFAALKYGHPHAKLLYSEYCTFAPQLRYPDYEQVKKQMYKVHKPHLTSTYLTSVRYERATDADGLPDWCMYYVPGPKAQAEYAAFNPRARRRAERLTAVLQAAAPEAVTRLDVAPSVAPTADAHALVQYFHQRFHGAADVIPTSAKVLAQAQDLLTRYGVEQASHVVNFSVTAAQETKYHPQTFSGIVQYTARALADYEKAQQRRAAAERAEAERRRAHDDEERRAQYEAYRAARVAQLRASMPPDELATVEADAAARFEREHTGQFGRESLRRMALDDAVATHGEIPSCAAWQEDETHGGRERLSPHAPT